MSHCSVCLMDHGLPKCVLSSCLCLFSLQISLPFSSLLTTSIFVLLYILGWILSPFLHYIQEEGTLITEDVQSFCCPFIFFTSITETTYGALSAPSALSFVWRMDKEASQPCWVFTEGFSLKNGS